ILVGIIAAAAILAILAIGGWVTGRFTGLCTALDNSPIGSCNGATGVGS
ncbi:MAG: Flp family type IVb pilin, partial [Mesorhizobium sp.]